MTLRISSASLSFYLQLCSDPHLINTGSTYTSIHPPLEAFELYCSYGTFLRKEIDLEDIFMQAAVWAILSGFLLPHKASAAVGVQRLLGS